MLFFRPRDVGEESIIIRTAGHGSPGRAQFRKPFTTFSASLKVKGTTMTSEAGLLFWTSSPPRADILAKEEERDGREEACVVFVVVAVAPATTAAAAAVASSLLRRLSAAVLRKKPPRRARARARWWSCAPCLIEIVSLFSADTDTKAWFLCERSKCVVNKRARTTEALRANRVQDRLLRERREGQRPEPSRRSPSPSRIGTNEGATGLRCPLPSTG